MENVITDIKVDDIVIMEAAGGWGYCHDNNGCYAIVERVSRTTVRNTWRTIKIDGRVLNPVDSRKVNFKGVPVYKRPLSDSNGGSWTVRPANGEELVAFNEDWLREEEEIEEIEI